MTHKKASDPSNEESDVFFLESGLLLTSYDCTHRASVCTSSTINASIRIDLIDVTL
mgnify:CR=1 FL=1